MNSDFISIIVSTYNSPDYLEKVLIGFNQQSHDNFEVIIADDGSTETTKNKITSLQSKLKYKLIHAWHEDNGFQKCVILNKAITLTNSDYIVFTDGDCIPRKDFLSTHLQYREKGYFLSGGYFKLSQEVSDQIDIKAIITGNCFTKNWLIHKGLKKSIKNLKLTTNRNLAQILNSITPTNASWNGHNASGWKEDIICANGFDERMQYGGEDRELGERLFNTGIQSKQIRYSAICIHLEHARGYVEESMLIKNKAIREETKKNKKTHTAFGINKEL